MTGKANEGSDRPRPWVSSLGGLATLAAIIGLIVAITSCSVTPTSTSPMPPAPPMLQSSQTPQAVPAPQMQRTAPHIDIQDQFVPSGWMGDGEEGRKYIEFSTANRTDPHSAPESIKVRYTFGPNNWGGIYFQNLPDNWGAKPGFDYSGKGFSKVTFWARGHVGGEKLDFKVGGIDAPRMKHRDSMFAEIKNVRLTKTWSRYTIDLTGANLSSVIGGFCWVASGTSNTGKSITFYLDDIVME